MKRILFVFGLTAVMFLFFAQSFVASIPQTQALAAINTNFTVHTIDDVDEGFNHHYSQIDMVIGNNDAIHISSRGPNRDLQYAKNEWCGSEDDWFTESVYDTSLGVARENGIDLRNGRPVISFSYRDGSDEDLYRAEMQISGTWRITPTNAIAIDSMDNIHIAHWRWSGRQLLYTSNLNGWVPEVVDEDVVIWALIRIALDSHDNVHIVYTKRPQNMGDYEIWHAYGVSGAWHTEKVANGFHPSVAIDNEDNLHISYDSDKIFYYATTNDSEEWVSELIIEDANMDDINSDRAHDIAVDQDGNVHFSFYNSNLEALQYAHNKTGEWEFTTVDNTPNAGYSNAIEVDSLGYVHISYRYEADDTPKLRYATNVNCDLIIDIRPNEFPNEIFLHYARTTKVAILSSPSFDAPSELDWNSLTFGHNGTETSLHVRGVNRVPLCRSQDENGDGLRDLTCHFDTLQTGLRSGDLEGVLMGTTLKGTRITGTDSLIVRPGIR